jgi:hypothetical protein
MFRKKKPAADIGDIAVFFAEIVSRSKEFLARPVRIHFIADALPQNAKGLSDLGDFLPFLRTVLFDAAQHTTPNPHATLHIHTAGEGSAADITAAIAAQVRPEGEDYFVLTMGKAGMQKDAVKGFAGLSPETRRHITLFHLPLGMSGGGETSALVSAVRILLKGEPIAATPSGLRTLSGKNVV